MKIALDAADKAALLTRLTSSEDAEMTGENEYVADIYAAQPPVTVEMDVSGDGVDVLAAELLAYDAAMDGYYIAGRVEDAAALREALLVFARGEG